MTADTELDDLLRATATGDRAAFRLLYDRVSPKLFGIAMKICRDQALAEDVLQEVFTDVWRRARNYLTLVDCLGRLDQRQRDLILRAYYRGDTREDLARAFDTPVNTIKTWLRRGLTTLRSCLDE